VASAGRRDHSEKPPARPGATGTVRRGEGDRISRVLLAVGTEVARAWTKGPAPGMLPELVPELAARCRAAGNTKIEVLWGETKETEVFLF